MAANETMSDGSASQSGSSMAIAIVLPALFGIVLILLVLLLVSSLVTAECSLKSIDRSSVFILPRITRAESATSKEACTKKRMAALENSVKAQHFIDWAAKQKEEHPAITVRINQIW